MGQRLKADTSAGHPPVTRSPAGQVALDRVGQGLATIKAHMPQTYAAIQRQAQARGNAVFALVRRGCGGQPDCFYAVEAGHVVGTPFAQAVDPALASLIVQFGIGFLVLLQQAAA